MSKVVCVRTGDKYGQEYVDVLRKMVKKHSDADVFCLDDRLLRCGLPGWWAKMELFAPWNKKYRPFLYFDLDTLILGDISDMVKYEPEGFMMLTEFSPGYAGAAQSSIMFIPKEVDHIWEEFIAHKDNNIQRYPSDQEFLNQFDWGVIQEKFKGIKSYKFDQQQDKPTGRIICFHGRPKPVDCAGWAKEVWDGYIAT